MSSPRFSPEFKDEAVRQVTQRGYPVVEVAKRIGVSANSLYKWVRDAKGGDAGSDELAATKLEMQKLKAELRRVLRVHRSGYYAWLKKPMSDRAIEDARLLGLIKDFHEASGGAYGSPRVFLDLRDDGETCGRHRVARVMKQGKVRAIRSYKKPRYVSAKPSLLAPNVLQREFTVDQPDQVWVTDITYIRTWRGFLYLAVVMDLYSRKIVGWSMKTSLAREIVIDALLMAVWRRKPKNKVLVHSDQGSQYGSFDCRKFCETHDLTPSMSRRGNCWDNAVAESFFSSLKKERIRRKVYHTVEEAKADLFDYIEMFYNPKRRHGHIGNVNPEAFERASNSDL